MQVYLIVLLTSTLVTASTNLLDNALTYATKQEKLYDKDLLELVSIPSISSLPDHADDVKKAAHWLSDRLTAAGLEDVKILSTPAQPAVYAQWLHAPAGAPTVLCYGHYDVQPVDPLDLWSTPPFEPTVDRSKGGVFTGRGASDDKGGLLQPLHAVEAFLKSSKALPVNVKFLFEGQEEIGSPHLAELLRKHKKLLAADIALSADGGQITESQAGIALGYRGGVAFQMEAQTVAHDLHSGMKGGSVQNPIHALASFISDLHAPDGRVAVQGFYDGVREISDEDRADAAAFPFAEAAEMRSLGASGPHGEAGYSTLERRWLRPTLDVVGIWGGFQGIGIKTIVPAKAFAKISCRLVPDQDPDAVMAALKRHVEAHAPPHTNLSFSVIPFRASPYVMPRDTPGNRAAAKVLKGLFEDVKFYKEGGSIPALVLFREHLGMYMTTFSFGLPDNNIHAPNEKFQVSMWDLGREAWIRLLQELADSAGAGSAVQSEEEL